MPRSIVSDGPSGGVGSGAPSSRQRGRQPLEMGFFAVDHVLVRVVDVVPGHVHGDGPVMLGKRQPVAVALLQQGDEVGGFHAFCFSLQLMQTRVQGIACRRASAMGLPQSRQTP